MPLNPERAEAIFTAALAQPSIAERASFVKGACRDEPEMLARVESLLQAHDGLGSFLVPSTRQTQTLDVIREGPGTRIGRYKLLQLIGEGGFGSVFMAEQEEPVRRRVALKIVKLGMDTRQVIARFEAERQALALMDHPNIAKVFDAGATETGRPFFVMELVKGVPITEYCDKNNLNTRERLALFVAVCNAVQHAHQKGVIHRDIKPSNVLVTLHDGKPVPKVIDFGIAKATSQRLTEKTVFTEYKQFIGTPAYTSPEQAEMSGLDVDTRSDIYSLGVLLYELLTGATPFDPSKLREAAYVEIQRIIREVEPPRPSVRLSTMGEALTVAAKHRSVDPAQLSKQVRGDLDWIVMKCLEKDRTRRYETANGLAMDITRHLGNEAVVARPASAAYRFRKLVRRNKLAFVAVAAVIVALLLGAVVSMWQAVRATRANEMAMAERATAIHERGTAEEERAKAERARNEAESAQKLAETRREESLRNLYFAQMNLATEATDAPLGLERVSQLLAPWKQGTRDLRGWEWYYLAGLYHRELLTLHGHNGSVRTLAWSHDNSRLVSGGDDGTVRVWDALGGRCLLTIPAHTGRVSAVSWNPRDARVASAGADGAIRIWDSTTGMRLLAISEHKGAVNSVAWSPDGTRLASGGVDQLLKVWDPTSGLETLSIDSGADQLARPSGVDSGYLVAPVSAANGVNSIAWSPDGTRLAAAVIRASAVIGALKIWDSVTGNERLTVADIPSRIPGVNAVTWSPDGRQLVSGRNDGFVQIWDATTGNLVRNTLRAAKGVVSVAWSADGARVAAATKDWVVDIFDLQPTNTPYSYSLRGHSAAVNAVCWSPDNRRLASASDDGSIKIWKSKLQSEPMVLSGAGFVQSIAWKPDGTRLVVGSSGTAATIWDTQTGAALFALRGHKGSVYSLAWSPDGMQVATGSETVRIWDAAKGKQLHTLNGHTGGVRALAFSLDGRRLASGSTDHSIKLWDMTTAKEIRTLSGHADGLLGLACSPDGKRLASCDRAGVIKIWDFGNGAELLSIQGHAGPARTVAWSRDGTRLASAGDDRVVKVWDVVTGKQVLALRGHTAAVYGVAWSLDDTRIVSASQDKSVRLWSATSGDEILWLPGWSDQVVGAVVWSSDGSRIASGRGSDTFINDVTPGYLHERSSMLIPLLGQRLMTEPNDSGNLRLRAQISARQGKWDEAAADIKKYLVLKPDKSALWFAGGTWVAGPFAGDLKNGQPFESASDPFQLLPDMKSQVDETVGPSHWQAVTTDPDGFVDLDDILPGTANGSAYALTRIYASENQRTPLAPGAAGPIRVWINGRLIHDRDKALADSAAAEKETAMIDLAAGWNTLLVKSVRNTGQNSWTLRVPAEPDVPDSRDSPSVIPIIGNALQRAVQANSVGTPDDATKSLEEALKMAREQLGGSELPKLSLIIALGNNYYSTGRTAQAIALFEELRANLDSVPILTIELLKRYDISCLDALGGAYRDAGRLEESRVALEEVIAYQKSPAARSGFPNAAPANDSVARGLGLALRSLGMTLIREGKFADAEASLREAMAIFENTSPRDNAGFKIQGEIGCATVQSALGEALAGQRKFADAEPLLVQGYEGLKKNVGSVAGNRKKRLADALSPLIQFYTDQGKLDEAAKWRAELTTLEASTQPSTQQVLPP